MTGMTRRRFFEMLVAIPFGLSVAKLFGMVGPLTKSDVQPMPRMYPFRVKPGSRWVDFSLYQDGAWRVMRYNVEPMKQYWLYFDDIPRLTDGKETLTPTFSQTLDEMRIDKAKQLQPAGVVSPKFEYKFPYPEDDFQFPIKNEGKS